MKYTLLELTQDILSSMDSDEIGSITDSVESQQVVKVIKSVYDDIISRGDLNTNKTPFNLVASTDNTKPVLMTKPEGIDRIEWIKYDCQKSTDTSPVWNDMQWLSFEDFIHYTHQYNGTETDVESMTLTEGYTFTFNYKNDTAPLYYTSYNDTTLIFDAYDKSVDTTLKSSKTLCYGTKKTEWAEEDTFIPNLQPQQFALLLNEAKSLAWAELKQTAHSKAEQASRRNWIHLQKTRQEVPDTARFKGGAHNFDKLPNFSRQR